MFTIRLPSASLLLTSDRLTKGTRNAPGAEKGDHDSKKDGDRTEHILTLLDNTDGSYNIPGIRIGLINVRLLQLFHFLKQFTPPLIKGLHDLIACRHALGNIHTGHLLPALIKLVEIGLKLHDLREGLRIVLFGEHFLKGRTGFF